MLCKGLRFGTLRFFVCRWQNGTHAFFYSTQNNADTKHECHFDIMSLILKTTSLMKKLLKKLKKLHGRLYVSKLLIKLPKSFFPSYRIIVSSVIIENNRKTLNFLSEDSSDKSFSTEFYDSLSSSSYESSKCKKLGKCCKHCRKLYYPEDPQKSMSPIIRADSINLRPEKQMLWKTLPPKSSKLHHLNLNNSFDIYPQNYSNTPIKSVTKIREISNISNFEEIDDILPHPIEDDGILYTDKEEFLNVTPPLRRITVGDIQSVKLKPPSLNLPRTPEVHDMMAVLRRRFAAMHSPLFDDASSESCEDISDFGDVSWKPRHAFPIGVM